jgi:hypothetical protein
MNKSKQVQVFNYFTVSRPFGYILIFFTPIIIAMVCVWFWGLLRPYFPTFSESDSRVLQGVAALLGLPYSIFAVQIMRYNWGQFQEIQFLCRYTSDSKNKDIYLSKKDLRIHILVHSALGTLAFLVTVMLAIATYHNPLVGQIVIGAWIYTVILFFVMTNELDNPTSGIWYIEPPSEYSVTSIVEANKEFLAEVA